MMLTNFLSSCTEMFSPLLNAYGNFGMTAILACAVLMLYFYLHRGNHSPPGLIGLPVVGYLPFLGSEPFKKLHELKKQYGNVFGLYFGSTYVVILADFDAVKEAFSKPTTTDRPEIIFDFIPDGVGFSSVNGEEWVEQRKYSVKAMRHLGLGRSNWESLMEVEVEELVKMISDYEGRPFDICPLLTASVSNNIASLIFGKREPLTEQNIEFLNTSVNAVSQFFSQVGLRNYFPWLCDTLAALGISQFATYHNKLVTFNQYVRDQVEYRKKNADTENSENYIDGYLREIKNNEEKHLGNTFNYTNLYGNVQALFIGASDTTRTSLNWLFLTMASFLDIQKKVQKEIEDALGRSRSVQWSDRVSLPFTYACIMEGQRWKTVAPLNTSRIAMEDITIGGYQVTKGTTIIANNWGQHFDTKYWKEPEQFRPERFLSPDGKEVNLNPESYAAFSYGKRNCPAEIVAMMEMLCYFVTILQKFDILPPEGQIPYMQGALGLTYQAVPQQLRFVRRE